MINNRNCLIDPGLILRSLDLSLPFARFIYPCSSRFAAPGQCLEVS